MLVVLNGYIMVKHHGQQREPRKAQDPEISKDNLDGSKTKVPVDGFRRSNMRKKADRSLLPAFPCVLMILSCIMLQMWFVAMIV